MGNDFLKQAVEYAKIPKLYVDILMVSGGLIFLTISKYLFPNKIGIYLDKFVNDRFFSGIEQTVVFFIVCYFVGGLILIVSDLLVKLPFFFLNIRFYLKNLKEKFQIISLIIKGEKIPLIIDETTHFYGAELKSFIDEKPSLKSHFSSKERSLIILNFTFFYLFFFIFILNNLILIFFTAFIAVLVWFLIIIQASSVEEEKKRIVEMILTQKQK